MEDSNKVFCILDRFKKFKKLGDVSEDGTTINKLCTACRNNEWQKDKIDISESVQKELQGVYSLVIDEEPGDILGRLRQTLRIRQNINPRQIIFVYSNDFRMNEISSVLADHVKGTDTKFQILRTFEQEYEREIIDIGVKSVDGMFYTVIKNGDILPRDFLYGLFHTIEVNLDKFIIVKPINGITGLTVLRLYHAKVNGNFLKPIEDKLEEDGEAWMIKTWPQIVSQKQSIEDFCKEIGVDE